jgi:hypothetical protein
MPNPSPNFNFLIFVDARAFSVTNEVKNEEVIKKRLLNSKPCQSNINNDVFPIPARQIEKRTL